MDVNTFKNYVKVISMGDKPFYADEMGLSGGEINGLKYWNMIQPTGNTKKVTIKPTSPYEDFTPFEVEAKEWVAVRNADEFYDNYHQFCGSWERKRAVRVANELIQNLEALQFLASLLG